MTVTFFETRGAMKKFKGRRWGHQETFKTPMKALSLFVRTIVARLEPVHGGIVTLGEVVFEPKHLNALLGKHGVTVPARKDSKYLYDWSISAVGREDLRAVMEAALGDWVDFVLVPDPAAFVVYADHDQFTTILGNGRGAVGGVSRKLSSVGFERLVGRGALPKA